MEKSTIKNILIVIGILAVIAGVAFWVYKFFFADRDDNFLDDIDDAFLDDDDDEDDPFDDVMLED